MAVLFNPPDESSFIHTVLNNPSYTPCLMIGNYVTIFKRIFTGTIERAYSVKDVRNIVEEYEGVIRVNSEFLVIEGIGTLSSIGQNSLLKFVEESSLPIILLSYSDKVLRTIRSRMKFVVKSWTPVKSLDFVSPTECIRALQEKKSKNPNLKGAAEIQFLADNSPELYRFYLEAGNPYDRNNSRVIDIITKRR